MFGWSLNPYMGCAHQCTFCYVRAFEKRADRPSDDRYGTSIRVKTNVAEVLRRELARRSWKGELVAIGAATDPYQPAEGRYRLTRALPRGARGGGEPVLDHHPRPARSSATSTSWSRPRSAPACRSRSRSRRSTTKIWRLTEPNTPPPRQRLRALARLRDAGIEAGVGMAPILPGLSDKPELMADVVRAARDAGATSIWTNVLYLRPGTREHFLEHLARDWPELAAALRAAVRGTGVPGQGGGRAASGGRSPSSETASPSRSRSASRVRPAQSSGGAVAADAHRASPHPSPRPRWAVPAHAPEPVRAGRLKRIRRSGAIMCR